MEIFKPNRLKIGDTIGVFSPSEPIIPERVIKINKSIEYLNKLGFRVLLGKNYKKRNYYMAGSVDERIEDVNDLLNNDEVGAILGSWGGKNANQLIPYLDYKLIFEKKKPFIGFSDGTCLANAIYGKAKLINFLGPNILGKLDESDFSDFISIREPNKELVLIRKEYDKEIIKSGVCRGRLFGGTINSFVMGVLNTQYEPDFNGGIFFVESGSRSPQDLDQILTYVINSKKLDNISGLIICNYDNCVDKRDWGGRAPLEIYKEKFKNFDIPIIHTPVIGHGKQINPILPVGALCELDANEGVLKAIEPIVN